MTFRIPNFQLERMDDPVVRESFQKVQGFWSNQTTGLKGVILDLILANTQPVWLFTESGIIAGGAYLKMGQAPSDQASIVTPASFEFLKFIEVSNRVNNTFDILVQEHDGTTFTDLATVSLNLTRERRFDLTQSVKVTPGLEIAVQVSSGSAESPVVRLGLSGSQ